MRTKKVLSILLVMIMALGLLGIVGASAEELVDEEIVVLAAGEEIEEEEIAVVAAAPALTGEEAVVQAKGWSEVDEIIITENLIHSSGSGTAKIVWEAFLANTETTPKQDSFYTLYTTAPVGTLADAKWEVERWIDSAWKPIAVQTNQILANATTGAYFEVKDKEVTLSIGQPTNTWYGTVRARLTVYVGGDSLTSPWRVAELVDTKDLAEKINDAKDELKLTDRHTEKYINNLKAVLAVVEAVFSTSKLTKDDVAKYITYLEFALQGRNAVGEPVGFVWKLADKNGDGFIDGLLGQSFIAFIWKVVDIFNIVSEVVKPMIDFFGEIGSFFGYLMPFFSLFTGLLGF